MQFKRSTIWQSLVLWGLLGMGGGVLPSAVQAQSGTVWGWGDNDYGQLGDNTITDRSAPVQVLGSGGSGTLTNIKAIAAGQGHTVALKSNGTVWVWGRNSVGQLGDNTTTQRLTPVQVKGTGGSGFLTSIKAIATGYSHSVALRSDGTVWAWGSNSIGQLGDNTTDQRNAPVQVVGSGGSGTLTGIKAIAAGEDHVVALKSNGTVWTWGWNSYGQLGINSSDFDPHSAPVQVKGTGGSGFLTGIKAIAAGARHTIALKGDGTVWAWGWGFFGQLGNNDIFQQNAPVQVVGSGGSGNLTDIKAIAGGYYHTIAIKSDGTVWTWGYNGSGGLGDNTTTNRSTPVQVLGSGGSGFLTGIKAITGGQVNTAAVKSDGSVWTWGGNGSGQLGDNTTSQRNTPVQVVGTGGSGFLTGIFAISIGHRPDHLLAIKAEGTLTATGRNTSRQLGDNTSIDRNAPVNVTNVANPIGLAASIAHSLVLLSDGTFKAWGHNVFGQCANGNTVSILAPPVSGSQSNLIAVASGAWHSLLLYSDGTVKAAGYNGFGQLGNGTTANSSSLVTVTGLSGIVALAGGGHHSLALGDDGTVYAWGNNTYGQLGQGNNTDSSTPLVVTLPESAIAIASGAYHSLAVGVSGTVYVWGRGGQGQIGNAANLAVNSPVVLSLSGILETAGGVFHSLALDDGGGIHVWGGNEFGQLGDGLSGLANNRNTPFEIVSGGYVGLSGGAYHSLALGDTGLGNTWGYNSFGQLGDSTNINKTTPTALSTVYSLLAAGWYHSLLLP